MKTVISSWLILLTLFSYGQYDIENVKKDSIQTNETSFFSKIKPNIYVGGEASLSLGNGGTFIYFSPFIGYDITQRFSGGISAMYQLYRFNGFNYNSYGGGAFLRYRPIEQLILQTEFDIFNTLDLKNNSLNRVNVPAFMAGAGFANRFGTRAYYQILLMYDFINDPNMPLTPFLINQLHLKLGVVWYLTDY